MRESAHPPQTPLSVRRMARRHRWKVCVCVCVFRVIIYNIRHIHIFEFVCISTVFLGGANLNLVIAWKHTHSH